MTAYLEKLIQLPTGAKLIKLIIRKIAGHSISKISFEVAGFDREQREETCFDAQRMAVIFNPVDIEQPLGCIGRRHLLGSPDRSSVDVFDIGHTTVPGEIILGHELIHVLHFLYDPKRYADSHKPETPYAWNFNSLSLVRAFEAASMGGDLIHPESRLFYYEEDTPRDPDTSRHRKKVTEAFFDREEWYACSIDDINKTLWKEPEEQITLLGYPPRDEYALNEGVPEEIRDISELALRAEAGLPMRYAYSNGKESFYEEADVIKRVFDTYKIQEAEYMRAIQRKEFNFNPQAAAISNFNIQDYSLFLE